MPEEWQERQAKQAEQENGAEEQERRRRGGGRGVWSGRRRLSVGCTRLSRAWAPPPSSSSVWTFFMVRSSDLSLRNGQRVIPYDLRRPAPRHRRCGEEAWFGMEMLGELDSKCPRKVCLR
jgi:hypothetical protein